MVLQGLLKTPSHNAARRTRPSSQRAAASQGSVNSSPEPSPPQGTSESPFICEEQHLKNLPTEDPDLRDLNNSLAALTAIFPDVQVEVFREMLSSFAEESRLAVVTEALLKSKMKWVRGRYRIAAGKEATGDGTAIQPTSRDRVRAEEKFRSIEYKRGVKATLYREFKGLSRSTINAVLAEHNYSYTLARPTLVALSSKSWRFSLSSLFLRRKSPSSMEAEHHPLVIWQSSGQDSIMPAMKPTGSPELDKELFDTLIGPIKERMQIEQKTKDHALALELNENEAEANQSLHDCECCFTGTTFEDLSSCDTGGHVICFRCVRHAVNEAIFGQGWQRNINVDHGTLRCLAAMSDDCEGCIPNDLIRRAFCEDKEGTNILRKLDERLAEDNLRKTQLPLIRCPFCSYAEIDDLYLPESHRSWRLKRTGQDLLYTLTILILGVGMIPFLLPVLLLVSFLFLIFSSRQSFADYVMDRFTTSMMRLRRKHHGLKFICQNPSCGRPSCISCSKAWNDVHICHESSLLALRTQVELAMSLAIKRTCPKCNTSFVKSSGCNKLTCVCGYQMCYVCRKDIGTGEGYRHFCEHFRPNGAGDCTECSKCDLYRCEDDEAVVRKAKEEAERQWMGKEGTDLSNNGKLRKVLEDTWKKEGAASWWDDKRWQWKAPNWQNMLDAVVETVVE